MIQLSGSTEYVFKVIESWFWQDVKIVEHKCFSKSSILGKAKYAKSTGQLSYRLLIESRAQLCMFELRSEWTNLQQKRQMFSPQSFLPLSKYHALEVILINLTGFADNCTLFNFLGDSMDLLLEIQFLLELSKNSWVCMVSVLPNEVAAWS